MPPLADSSIGRGSRARCSSPPLRERHSTRGGRNARERATQSHPSIHPSGFEIRRERGSHLRRAAPDLAAEHRTREEVEEVVLHAVEVPERRDLRSVPDRLQGGSRFTFRSARRAPSCLESQRKEAPLEPSRDSSASDCPATITRVQAEVLRAKLAK
jgi:hypothetical protein